MKRCAWNIFCALSLLLFLASVTLGIRGWLKRDSLWTAKVLKGLDQRREVEPEPLPGILAKLDKGINEAKDDNTKQLLILMKMKADEWARPQKEKQANLLDIQTFVQYGVGSARACIGVGGEFLQVRGS